MHHRQALSRLVWGMLLEKTFLKWCNLVRFGVYFHKTDCLELKLTFLFFFSKIKPTGERNRKVLTETGSRTTGLSFNIRSLYQLSYLNLYSSAI